MKKIFLILTLLILSMNYANSTLAYEPWQVDTEPSYCDIDYVGPLSPNQIQLCDYYDNELPSLVDRSDYTRIEKIDGIWYGVINVSDVHVESAYIGIDHYWNSISVSFTRDLEDLKQIELYIVTEDNSCIGILAFNRFCIGSKADSYSDTIIISSTSNADNFLSFLEGDYIHENDEYDYILFHSGPEIATVTVIKFTYILTDIEIDDLRLDIQEQYENEKEIIYNNPLLSDNGKVEQLILLMEEYVQFEIDYGEEMTSICIGDQCTAINEDTTGDLPGIEPPDWLDNTISTVIKGVGYFIGAVTGTVIVGFITYILISKTLSATGNVALGGIKATYTSSSWWGKTIATGILTTLGVIGTGIKTLPTWLILTLIGVFTTIVIILF